MPYILRLNNFVNVFLLTTLLVSYSALALAKDPLPSWQNTPTKTAIIHFVEDVTDPNSPNFVPKAERIATFDNDGTLWAEQPMYAQLLFAIDRLKALAPKHPEWKQKEPFKSILNGDLKAVMSEGGKKALIETIIATHTGMSSEDFSKIVKDWMATAKHPTSGRPFTKMVYQPMLELLDYLRANDFKTYIVSGGSMGFMRPWTEAVYGIPPEQVIGSSVKTQYKVIDGQPTIVREAGIHFSNNNAGKPVGINEYIGRQPIAAFGNSDGDLEMLQWTTSGKGKRFGLLVHHTDAKREWAYDRKSSIGHLDKALDMATQQGWTLVDMKNDWKIIFPDS